MKHLSRFNDFLIKEGLIKTYNSNFVVNYLVKNTSLKEDDVWVSEGQNDTEKIKIEFKKYSSKEIEKINNMMQNLFGWNLAKMQYDFYDDEYFPEEIKNPSYDSLAELFEKDEDNEEFIIFIYEAKFDEEYNNENKIFYHVTDEKYIDKIFKIGLTPKSKNKISVHPSRIYLMENIENIHKLLDNIHIDIDDPVILKIDLNESNMKIYKDPNMPNAVYVLENINPSKIELIEI